MSLVPVFVTKHTGTGTLVMARPLSVMFRFVSVSLALITLYGLTMTTAVLSVIPLIAEVAVPRVVVAMLRSRYVTTRVVAAPLSPRSLASVGVMIARSLRPS